MMSNYLSSRSDRRHKGLHPLSRIVMLLLVFLMIWPSVSILVAPRQASAYAPAPVPQSLPQAEALTEPLAEENEINSVLFPRAIRDEATTQEEVGVVIDVMANDLVGEDPQDSTPPDQSLLVLDSIGRLPQNGTVEIISDSEVIYVPDDNFVGQDSFTYRIVLDGIDDPDVRANGFVFVTVTEVQDGPTDIQISNTSVTEGSDGFVATFDAVDPNGRGPHTFTLTPRTDHLDNDFFVIVDDELGLISPANFAQKPSYKIGVEVSNRSGEVFTKEFTLQVRDAPDPPTAVRLSNTRINENQPAGTLVGTLTTVDPDSDSHTYELVEFGGAGEDNRRFRIQGDKLLTNEVLDFELKASYRIQVGSEDESGGFFEQALVINLNNLPSPPDAKPNPLTFCSGDAITLIDNRASSNSRRVRVTIDNVSISQKTSSSCRVSGRMSISAKGKTVRGFDFSGTVNGRNQFSNTTMDNFSIGVAGITLEARDVEVQYVNEQPSLHITRPQLRMPREFGGLSAGISVPAVIDASGVRFGTGTLRLPTIRTGSGFELSLEGRLRPVAGGFQIDADGTVGIPNIGRSRTSGSRGRTCAISAGVTIFANDNNQTVLAIAAGNELIPHTAPTRENAALINAENASFPSALDDFRLDKVRAGISCSPGLAIGSTGLFLTGLRGEITVTPGREEVNVAVTIETAKSIPGIGPIAELEGRMRLRPRPFLISVGATLNVLSFEIARANATLTTRSFRATVQVRGLFYRAGASIAIFSSRGRVIFTGSGEAAVFIPRRSFGPLPRRDRDLASVRIEAGQFRDGDTRREALGFKGIVKILFFSLGVFINQDGKFKIGGTSRFQLVNGQLATAARAAQRAILNGESIQSASMIDAETLRDFVFLENERGESEGLIVNTRLDKPMTEPGEVRASDVTTQVNLIRHGDVIFSATATEPMALSLISPEGTEITPANYSDGTTIGHTVAYTWSLDYERVEAAFPGGGTEFDESTITDAERAEAALPRLRFTTLATDPALNGIDLRVDGVVWYENLAWRDTARSKPLPLNPGEHTVELLRTGTNDIILSGTLMMEEGKDVSLLLINGTRVIFGTLPDDNAAPSTMGKAKVRFFNGSGIPLSLNMDGNALFGATASLKASEYALVDPGAHTLEFRKGDNTLGAEALAVDLADGGVYTFFSLNHITADHNVSIVQRIDRLYTPYYQAFYVVDQAQMGQQWQMKLVGDTDNVPFQLEVLGTDSPPILGSVTYDASDLANTQIGWQLTSDVRPTTVSIYANGGEITTSIPITNSDGTTGTKEITQYEGILIGEFEIDDINELGGQTVTKVVDLSGLASGTWNLWVRADDGVSPHVSSYASTAGVMAAGVQSPYGVNAVWLTKEGFDIDAQAAAANTPLVIDRTGDFPTEWTATISPTFDAADNSLYIEWAVSRHPDVDTYRLHWGDTALNPTQVITAGGAVAEFDEDGNETGRAVGFITLHNIRPDTPYFLSVESVDSESGKSVRSQEVQFMVEAAAFALATQVADVTVKAGNSVQVPVTLSADDALFFNNVWLSTDLGGTPLGVTAQYVGDTDGFQNLNAETPTIQLEVSVDASVPAGKYPISITGYNGDAKEETTFTLTVEAGATQPSTTDVYLPLITR